MTALLAFSTAGCAGSVDGGEQYPNGDIFITDMVGDGCTYNPEQHGILFEFTLTGHKSTDLVAEVHRRGADEDHPGTVIASKTLPVRGGDYHNPVSILVPLDRSTYRADRPRCILQTYDRGPGIISAH